MTDPELKILECPNGMGLIGFYNGGNKTHRDDLCPRCNSRHNLEKRNV